MEAIYEKFLPQDLPEWHMPFWESLRQHDVKVQRCDRCEEFRYVPKEICWRCQCRQWSWHRIDGGGAIYTYSIVHRAPTPSYQQETPYAIVHVTMKEDFRMIGTMTSFDLNTIHVGQAVKIAYDDVTPHWTLLRFTADD